MLKVKSKPFSTHPAVDRDIVEIVKYIARQNTAAAYAVGNAIVDQFLAIARTPGLGTPFANDVENLEGLRMFPVPRYRNYLIFYLVKNGEVRILYVFHGARDILEEMETDIRN